MTSRKVMGLLAYVAMRAGEPVARSHVAGLLWPDVPDDQARSNLHHPFAHCAHRHAKGLRHLGRGLTIGNPGDDQFSTVNGRAGIPMRVVQPSWGLAAVVQSQPTPEQGEHLVKLHS